MQHTSPPKLVIAGQARFEKSGYLPSLTFLTISSNVVLSGNSISTLDFLVNS